MGNQLSDCYVYIYYRPNGVPCYVGKGRRKRWLRTERETKNPHLARIIKQAGGTLPKIKYKEGLSEQDAFDLERRLIREIGRRESGGPLVNMTDGGDGASALSPEACAAISRVLKGRPKSEAARAAMRVPKGPMSEVAKDAIRAGQLASEKFRASQAIIAAKLRGVPKTEAHRIAAGLARRGIGHSDEAKAKMSAAAKRRGVHPNFRAAGLNAIVGRPVNTGTRRKISLAQKGRPKTSQAIAAATAARNLTFLAKRILRQLEPWYHENGIRITEP